MKAQGGVVGVALLFSLSLSRADSGLRVSYPQALALASERAPGIAVARSQEAVASAEIGVAGVYPNPTLAGGTSTQAAKLFVGLSVPLIILGQREAAMRAARTEAESTRADTDIARADARAGAAHGFVGLWLAEGTAETRVDAEKVAVRIDDAVHQRIDLGAVPEVEGVRTKAQRLRAQADALEAQQLVAAAAADFGRWLGVSDASQLRTDGEPSVPLAAPVLSSLLDQVDESPSVKREQAQARAARARADRERALVRPAMTLDLGIDAFDPALPGANYRAQLGLEVPLFNQRGPNVEREERAAATALLRTTYESSTLRANLVVAYRTFQAFTDRATALLSSVLPAAEAAARATQESYSLGRASLEAVLDAERTRIDAQLLLLEARAMRAQAWIDVERALGAR
jgi:outer membrane protein TolC